MIGKIFRAAKRLTRLTNWLASLAMLGAVPQAHAMVNLEGIFYLRIILGVCAAAVIFAVFSTAYRKVEEENQPH